MLFHRRGGVVVKPTGTPFGQEVARERAVRGWTLRELAVKSGLAYSRIHRIETDPNRDVTFEDALRLGKAFGVPSAWLLRGGELRNRILAAARASDRDDAEHAVSRVLHVLELAEQLETHSAEPVLALRGVEFTRSADESPAAWGRCTAEQVRVSAGIQGGPIEDIAAFIEDNHWAFVVVDDLPETVDGLAVRDSNSGRALVAAGTALGWERQRFTLAHELGHLLAGEMKIETVPTGATRQVTEVMANEFARNLLVPMADVLAHPRSLERAWTVADAAKLAWEYRVSPQVLGIQLERAGVVDRSFIQRLAGATAEAWSVLGGWSPARRALAAGAGQRRIPPMLADRALEAWKMRHIATATHARLLGIETSEAEELLAKAGMQRTSRREPSHAAMALAD